MPKSIPTGPDTQTKGTNRPDERRDRKTGLQSNEPGDADANLDQQGRFGNMRQNLTPHLKTQDR